MYERSAIVLERYFDKLLDYNKAYNLRYNFKNYCNLVEKLEKYQINYQKEMVALKEYNEVLDQIRQIQLSEKNLYKVSAKLEYDRNLLFKNIDGKVDETRKCIEKIEEDVVANNEAMKDLKEALLETLEVYNNKKFELSKAKRYKKIAENEYNEVYDKAKETFDNIEPDTLLKFKSFNKFSNEEEVEIQLEDNGKNEKIPFNVDVMENATKFFVVIAKYEADSYQVIYEKMKKLLGDIEEGTVRINLHKKYVRNEKAKVDFLYAVKNYIVQFLDYERMTVIHGRKSHNRLMQEACENFQTDVEQINNLYDLLLKEIANKATKKSYKDLYNKSYLIDIKENEEKFKREKNKVNLDTATMVNTNYWRIDGIRDIYTTFYKNVSEVFGRDVVEFDIPKSLAEEESEDGNQELGEYEDIEEENTKIPFEIAIKDDIDPNIMDELDDEDDFRPEPKKRGRKPKVQEESVEQEEQEEPEDVTDEFEEEDIDDDAILTSSRMKPKRKKLVFEEDDESDSDEEEEEEEQEEDSTTEDLEDYQGFDDEDSESKDSEEFDIFGEKYQNTDFIEANVVAAANNESNLYKEIEDNTPVNEEEDELQLFGNTNVEPEDNEEDYFEEEFRHKKSGGIFSKFKNSRKKNTDFEDDIW